MLYPIAVRSIAMSAELSATLDYASKLKRDPAFITRLMADGEKQAEAFLAAFKPEAMPTVELATR